MKTIDHRPRYAWDERLNLPHGSVENIVHGSAVWHKAQTGQVTPQAYWEATAAQLRISPEAVRELARDFYSGDRLDETLIDYIQHLRGAGVQVALLSNDSAELLPRLEHLGIDGLFDPLVISAFIGVMKPDPAAYEAVLTRMGRPAAEAVFVDDMPANVEGAQRVGLQAVRYTPGMNLAAALEPLLESEL